MGHFEKLRKKGAMLNNGGSSALWKRRSSVGAHTAAEMRAFQVERLSSLTEAKCF